MSAGSAPSPPVGAGPQRPPPSDRALPREDGAAGWYDQGMSASTTPSSATTSSATTSSETTSSVAAASRRVVHRTCPLCEAACGLRFTVEEERVVDIRGDEKDPFSQGFVCHV